jgi:hypothetical protein
MAEFILLFVAIGILPRRTLREKKIYCISVCILMCCLVGLRNINIGQLDTVRGYIPEFKRILNMSYKDIFVQFKDPIFYVVEKLWQQVSTNEYVFLFVFGIPYNASIAYFIYKYSDYPGISFVAVMGLSIWKYAFTGMRHVMAAAFLICAFIALVENKKKLHWTLIIIAACFHSTAIIFFIVYPLTKFKKIERYIPLTGIIALFSFLLRKYMLSLIGFILSLLKSSRYIRYSQVGEVGNLQGYLLNLLIITVLLFIYGTRSKIREDNISKKSAYKLNTGNISFKLLDTMQFITLILYALSPVIFEFSRVATFFGFSTIVLIPQYINLEKNEKTKIIIRLVISFCFAILFLFIVAPRGNLIPYYFNWEQYR